MIRTYLCILALGFTTLQASSQDNGVIVWPKGVPPAGTKQKVDFGDHDMSISHRSGDGKAEVHEMKADVMVVQSGSATLVTGGEVLDPVSTALHEIQGSGIRGGVTQIVGPGDIVNIPAGVPHQFFLRPGTQITYFIVKVVKQ